jgi:hypothetical protein
MFGMNTRSDTPDGLRCPICLPPLKRDADSHWNGLRRKGEGDDGRETERAYRRSEQSTV